MILPISKTITGDLITKIYMMGNKLCKFERYLENGKTKFRRATFEGFDGTRKLISEMFYSNGIRISKYRKEWMA